MSRHHENINFEYYSDVGVSLLTKNRCTKKIVVEGVPFQLLQVPERRFTRETSRSEGVLANVNNS